MDAEIPEQAVEELDPSTLSTLDALLKSLSRKYRFVSEGVSPGEELPPELLQADKEAQLGPVHPGVKAPSNAGMGAANPTTALIPGPSAEITDLAGSLRSSETTGGMPTAVASKIPAGVDATGLDPSKVKVGAASVTDAFLLSKLGYQGDPPAKDEEMAKMLGLALGGYGGFMAGEQAADLGSEMQASTKMRPLMAELRALDPMQRTDRVKSLGRLKELAAVHDLPFPRARFWMGKSPVEIGNELTAKLTKKITAGKKAPLGLLGAGAAALGVNQLLKKKDDNASYYG
jgi:hypothetical protein